MKNDSVYPARLYRDPDNGYVGGVCAGIADYLSIDATVVRAVVLVSAFLFSLPTLFMYVLGVIFLKRKPRNLYHDTEEETFWREYRRSPRNTLGQTSNRFRDLEKRLRKLEAYMTSKKYDLDREFRRMDRGQ